MAEPDLSRAYEALRKADAAGNTEDAKRLADYIRAQRAQTAAPTEPAPEEQGLMGHLRGALRGAAAEREPGLVRSFLELAAQPPGQGPLAAAVQSAGNVVPGAQQLAAGLQAGLTDQSYAQARQEQEARVQAGAEAHPTASNVGAGGAIITQLGGPSAVVSLMRSSPQLIRGLLSKGLLTPEALVGAVRGVAAGAGVGAALSDADIPLAEGRPAEAAGQAASAALDPAMLATGGVLGGAAGAAGQRLRQVAEARAKAAGQVQQLDDFNAAKAAHPAQVEAAKAQAAAAIQKPTPANATRWFGFDRLTKRKAGVSRARAVRLMNEPVPTAPAAITEAETKAAHAYWDQGTKINEALRSGQVTPEVARTAGELGRAIEKSPLSAPTTTWRGLVVPPGTAQSIQVGSDLRTPAFTSTTANQQYALQYAKGQGEKVLVEYALPAGTRALPFQEELILGPGQAQQVIGKEVREIAGHGPVTVLKVSPGMPPPTTPGETWMQARERFGTDVAGWQKYADEVKTRLGESLGEIRDALTKVDDVRVDAKGLKEKLEQAGGEFPEESIERLVNKAKAWVDKGAKDGVLSPERLRQLIKNLEGAGEDAYALRRAAVDVEKRLIAQHLPQENERYRRLLGQWADANELSQGAEAQFRALNKGSAPVRFDKPVKAVVPEPQFPGGPDAQKAAEKLLDPYTPAGRRFGRAVTRSAGGAIGGAIGQTSGIPYLGYGGAASGYQSAEAPAQRWFPAVRPTVKSIVADSDAAKRALARWGPHLDAALRRGPRAVRSLHRALTASDPDYKEMMETSGRTAPEPLSFGEFSNGWKRGQ